MHCVIAFAVVLLTPHFVRVNAGVSSATLLHSKSLRGHRDCFEKCHLIANQKLSRSKVSRSAYEGMKLALSQKLNRIIQYAQNKDSVSPNGPNRRGAKLLCYGQQNDRKLLPQSDAQVPRYTPRWDTAKSAGPADYTMGMLERHTAEELGLLQESHSDVWSNDSRRGLHSRKPSGGGQQHTHQGHSREECKRISSFHKQTLADFGFINLELKQWNIFVFLLLLKKKNTEHKSSVSRKGKLLSPLLSHYSVLSSKTSACTTAERFYSVLHVPLSCDLSRERLIFL